MELQELAAQIPDFSHKSHADKIKVFAWYLHTHKGRSHFSGGDLQKCFAELHLAPPSGITPFLTAMANRNPKQVLRSREGYCLERRLRDTLDAQLGHRTATVHVHKLLSELPGRVPDLAEKAYLEETLVCFQHRAFRAAIVMAWNLTYDHLCNLVLKTHLADFNLQLTKSFPKADISEIKKRDDFSELKESQVLQVCKSASIVSGSVHKILKEKLDRRNVAAHASGVGIFETTAEEFIKDLIENVVIKFQ